MYLSSQKKSSGRDEDGTSVRESEEADVIYYSTPSNYNSIPNIDVVSEADVEKVSNNRYFSYEQILDIRHIRI